MPFDQQIEGVGDRRQRENALTIDVHADKIHKQTFGLAILGFFVHLFRGKS